jgi:hypothetical protein
MAPNPRPAERGQASPPVFPLEGILPIGAVWHSIGPTEQRPTFRGQPGGQKIGFGLRRPRPQRRWWFKLGLCVSRGRATILDADDHAHSV